jgi:hypothetical protein
VHRLDLSIAARQVDVATLSNTVTEAIAGTGIVIPPLQSPMIVSTSRESTEITVSLLIPDQPEHRQTITDAIMASAGDLELEITVK